MIDFFKTVAGLLGFEKGPEDLPSSVPLLILSLAFFAFTSFGQAWFTESFNDSMGTAAICTAIMIIFIPVVLGIAGLFNRIIQTMTAFAIAGTVVNFFAIVSFALLTLSPAPMLELGITSPFKVPLTIYNLLLNYTILRRALSKSALVVFVLAILYLLLTYLLLTVQFTAPFTSDPKMEQERPRPEAGQGQLPSE